MKWYNIVAVIWISMMLGTYLYFYHVFLNAYQREDKTATIDFNSESEARFEFYLFSLGLVITPVGMYAIIAQLVNNDKKA